MPRAPRPEMQVSIGLYKIRQMKGMQSALARHLNVKRQAISGWNAVPINRLDDVERFTKIPREELRPDIFLGRRRRGKRIRSKKTLELA